MLQKINTIIAGSIVALLLIISEKSNAYSDSGTIFLYKKDVEDAAKKNTYSNIENCISMDHSFCLTVLGGAYYWELNFKEAVANSDCNTLTL